MVLIKMANKKQLKLTKLFRSVPRQPEENCDDLEEEIKLLEQQLKEKRDTYFQLLKNKHKISRPPIKNVTEVFVNPQKIMLTNSVESMKQKTELLSMLSGLEVQTYVPDEHCAVLYHMQHDSEVEIKHGLLFTMKNGVNEVTKSSLPLGFNLSAVLDGFKNVLQSDCILAVRKGLVAYYERLDQCTQLKKLLTIDTNFFSTLDGSHMEISFTAQNDNEEDPEPVEITLVFDYRVYDIRPKQFSMNEMDLSEEVSDIIRHQCAVFKKKPLHEAFKDAFIEGNGSFVLVSQMGLIRQPEQRRRRKVKPARPPNAQYNNDDTFHPEDCSASDDDVDEQ